MDFRRGDFPDRVFDVEDEPWPRGAWWWWFWLFFFDNPRDPQRPRQLMILWSTKNVDVIDCNSLKILLEHTDDRSLLDGAVAAWYFDGDEMIHNYLLEQGTLELGGGGLRFNSSHPSRYLVEGEKNIVEIGDNMRFEAVNKGGHDFIGPDYRKNTFPLGFSYSVLWMNRLDLSGIVDGKPINGSAYFQRVFVNAPAPSWYWGLFHFGNGQMLSYYHAFFSALTFKKDISYYDGRDLHFFPDMSVQRLDGKGVQKPVFKVCGQAQGKRISFTVESYSHSSWTFRKKSLGVMPNKLVYNEYPAKIRDFVFIDEGGKKTTLKDLGDSVGNAEHTTGLLF